MGSTAQPANYSLLTVQEAAEALRCSDSTVYRLMRAGELPWVKVSSRRRISVLTLQHYNARHEQGGALCDDAETGPAACTDGGSDG